MEQLQLESAARLQRALATYVIMAWRLLWITYQARAFPDQPADSVLAPHEWQALSCLTSCTKPSEWNSGAIQTKSACAD